MIAVIDKINQLINLYAADGVRVYSFQELDVFAQELEGYPIMYVTGYKETTAEQIVQSLYAAEAKTSQQGIPWDQEAAPLKQEQVISQNETQNFNQTQFDDLDDQVYFVRSTSKGPVYIADVDIEFNGPGDCREVDEEMLEIIRESFSIRQLIKTGRIQIMNRKQMQKAASIANVELKRRHDLWRRKESRELDSIIVGDGTPGMAMDIADGMFGGGDDLVVSVNLEDNVTKGVEEPGDQNLESLSPEEIARLFS